MTKKKTSDVSFASSKVKELRRNATLPAKFERMLAGFPLEKMFKGKSVAIKIHVGGDIGFTTVHPLFIRMVVDAVKKAGGEPFITDGSGAMQFAKARGYTEEVLGAPLIAAAGISNNYAYPREINYRDLESVDLCGNIVDADAMIVLSHGKGHGNSGFGAAIKNLAMGCVARDSRAKLHKVQGENFVWNSELCTRCHRPTLSRSTKTTTSSISSTAAATAAIVKSPARPTPSRSTHTAASISSAPWR
jgi:hypothetical protein